MLLKPAKRDHVGAPLTRDFTVRGLLEYLQKFRVSGYRCSGFDPDKIKTHKSLVLRHDVDLDLKAAVAVAQVEAAAGFTATYFVLMTSSMYNPFSVEATKLIRHLRELGHSIGLHYDASLLALGQVSDHRKLVITHAKRLEEVSNGPVRSFSAHRPATNGISLPDRIGELHNAYAPVFSKIIEYSSDSGGWWRYGRFVDSPAFSEGKSVQLLLHPIWWDSEPGELPYDRLERFINDQQALDRLRIAENISPYAAELGIPTDGIARWPIDNGEIRP